MEVEFLRAIRVTIGKTPDSLEEYADKRIRLITGPTLSPCMLDAYKVVTRLGGKKGMWRLDELITASKEICIITSPILMRRKVYAIQLLEKARIERYHAEILLSPLANRSKDARFEFFIETQTRCIACTIHKDIADMLLRIPKETSIEKIQKFLSTHRYKEIVRIEQQVQQ